MAEANIRHPEGQDIGGIVEIYVKCFPDRVRDVFGGARRRVFVGDYLSFYLAWDTDNTWVYASHDNVLGVIIAPCQYAPMRAALAQGLPFYWLWRGLTGQYGFPIHILRLFLSSGFAFSNDPAIHELWGRPYIHLLAVAPGTQGQGIGSKLLGWTLERYREQGITFCWLVVQGTNARGIEFYKRFGFWIYKVMGSGDIIMAWGNLPRG